MRISVDSKACAGHGFCFAESPELFPLDEYNYCLADGTEISDPEQIAGAEAGAFACPEAAITLDSRSA